MPKKQKVPSVDIYLGVIDEKRACEEKLRELNDRLYVLARDFSITADTKNRRQLFLGSSPSRAVIVSHAPGKEKTVEVVNLAISNGNGGRT